MADPGNVPTLLGVAEARARIVEICTSRRLPPECLPIEGALGRTTVAEVVAPFDVPGFANSAMDGFAVIGADLPASGECDLRLAGEILAGGASAPDVVPGTCVRITTGAPLPRGADTVVMKENTHAHGDVITVIAGTHAGANVRPAGEDFRAGDTAIAAGARLTPARLGVLASFGLTHVAVSRRPRAVLLTTGDEIVAPGQPLAYGQIHDSNRYSLGALLEQHGVDLVRHERVRDDADAVRAALRRAGGEADIVLSSGGVSAGEADFLPGVVAQIGCVHFWKVRIKPGMPFLFGEVGDALLFALPGNPVSGIAIFLTLLQPGLDALTGTIGTCARLRARLRQAVHKRHARAEFQRATLDCDETGALIATPHSRQGSGMLRGVAGADALIALPEGEHEFAPGDLVDVLPLPGWPQCT